MISKGLITVWNEVPVTAFFRFNLAPTKNTRR
jgi:hypothetical protein